MVKVRVVVPFSAMLLARNALLMVGGATTVRVAVLLVAPVPLSVELMVLVVLDFAPEVVPFTSTLMEHEPLDTRVPPNKLIVLVPAVAVSVPLHVLLVLGAEATCTPEGKVSLKATPVSAKPGFGLLMLKVTVLVPFSGMLVGENALLMVGGLATTRFAVAVLPVPPFVEVTLPLVLV